MKQIDGRMCPLSFQQCMSLVDEAISAGHDRRLLRWRVGAAQGLAIFLMNYMIAVNPSPVTANLDSGVVYESGTFCGLPYAVDRNLPQSTLLLERMSPDPIAEITNLMVTETWK